jgi:hypothetical protein
VNIPEAVQITNQYLSRPRSRTKPKKLLEAIRKVNDFALVSYETIGHLKTIGEYDGGMK